MMNKSAVLAIVTWTILIVGSRGEMYEFPKGERPSLSMEAAIQICKTIIKNTKIGEFNPTQATLAGAKNSEGGTWNFFQYGKNGEVYCFSIDFPEDRCIIMDQSKSNVPILAQKRDGTPIILPKPQEPAYKEGADPFREN